MGIEDGTILLSIKVFYECQSKHQIVFKEYSLSLSLSLICAALRGYDCPHVATIVLPLIMDLHDGLVHFDVPYLI